MAAPSGTTWGSTVGSYGRIGIYVDVLSNTATQLKYEVEVWFWSKYSVTDSNNTLYYDHKTASGSASTSKGSKSISTTVDSGSGWSTSNQKRLATYGPYTIDRTTSAQKRYIYAKLSNVDAVGGTMYASRTSTIAAKTSYTVSFNANGGSGAPASQTKWHGTALKLSATKPTRTGYDFQGWGTSTTDTSANYQPEGKYEADAAITLYAIWKLKTYSVSYNANGGTGAPGNQTKTYGKTLVLSATKPTRTGYDFQGWGTSVGDTTVDYQPEGKYEANAAITLYAIWKLKTYTVSFNANGGTGAPASQTKTYDVDLTLSSTKPTKPNYNFKGWSTSDSSTTVAYNSGGSYTANANITLYAVWAVAYKKPTISSLSVKRCDSNGDTINAEYGDTTSALVTFDWTTFQNVTAAWIEWETGNKGFTGTHGLDVRGTSGSIRAIIGDGELSMDESFTIYVYVVDIGEPAKKIVTLEGYVFTIDMLSEGKGVSFGKPAELENVADFEFEAFFRNGIRPLVLNDNADLNEIKTPNIYAGNAATTAGYLNCPITTGTSFTLEVLPAGGNGQRIQRITACSKTAPTVYVRHYYSDAWGDWITI